VANTFCWEAVPIPTSAIPTTRPIMCTVVSFDREFPPICHTPDMCGLRTSPIAGYGTVGIAPVGTALVGIAPVRIAPVGIGTCTPFCCG